MDDKKLKLLLLERRGLINLLNFYQYRLETEGPDPQIMSAIDDLLEMLFNLDRQITDLTDESGESDRSTSA